MKRDRPRILVLYDDAEHAASVRRSLEAAGFTVESCAHGSEADVLPSGFDLVVCDDPAACRFCDGFPGPDGAPVPVIVLTDIAPTVDGRRPYADHDGVLPCAAPPADLVSTVRALLAGRRR